MSFRASVDGGALTVVIEQDDDGAELVLKLRIDVDGGTPSQVEFDMRQAIDLVEQLTDEVLAWVNGPPPAAEVALDAPGSVGPALAARTVVPENVQRIRRHGLGWHR